MQVCNNALTKDIECIVYFINFIFYHSNFEQPVGDYKLKH